VIPLSVVYKNELDVDMEKEIKQLLRTKWMGHNVIYKECVDSTNIQAKQLGEAGVLEGTVVVARRQTAGKGRRGRNWMSPEGNCYFSILLRPDIHAERASRLTLVVALALSKAIRDVTGLDIQIKWPNDVVVAGKKLCGILTESSIDVDGLQYVVVGIGVNANQLMFDEELRDIATSVRLQLGEEIDCCELIAGCMNHFEDLYEVFLQTQDLTCLMEEYNRLLVNQNQKVRIIDKEERIGVALGINEMGELQVKMSDGVVENVISGEVSVRGVYGYV